MTAGVKRQLPFIFITLLVAATAFFDRLLPEGMFSDGMVYASVARNMAIGKGSLWMPYFGHGSRFWEHPPLMMGLESLFFRLLGNHYSTEKIYCAIVWLITVLLIRRQWLQVAGNRLAPLYWLPLLMWWTATTVLWSYPNNMLECTMALFDIAACMYIYKGCESAGNGNGYLAAGALFIVLATLTKGPVGLFPLALPVLHSIARKKHSLKKAMAQSLLLLLVFAVCYGLLCLFEAPRAMLAHYLDQQLISSLMGKRERVDTGEGRMHIILSLFIQLGPAAAILLLSLIAARIARVQPQQKATGMAMFFLLTGISASLPMVVSVKQLSFYLVPSLPFYAIAFALYTAPYMEGLTQRYTLPRLARRTQPFIAFLAIAGCAIYLWPKAETIGRDENIIHDIRLLSAAIPPGDTADRCPVIDLDNPFRAYAERYGQLEVKHNKYIRRFIIVDNKLCGSYTDSIEKLGYTRTALPTLQYDLYRR